jgi:FtsP/CotA-like multicopper oxidase with cupredoxin domain
MDGTAVAQAAVPPGGEFTYEFIVPDAGTFWYHPHIRSNEQVERGLYGAFVVRGDNEPTTTTDRTVVLDDLLVDPSTWQLEPFDAMQQAMVGREGNLILANGRARPIAPELPGGLHRYRFINSANARYFRLALPGHKLVQIGSDGGLLTSPRDLDELLLVPGERVDLLVRATGEATETFDWVTRPYERGHGMGTDTTANVFQVRNSDEAVPSASELPASLANIAELPAPRLRRELRLEESMGSMEMTMAGMAPSFSINGETYPNITPLVGALGSVEDWAIVNTTEMDHPFHLHGFRFQIVSDAGIAVEPIAWRDTINIPAKTTVAIRIPLEDHPGTWVYHCHILEHAERGMMGELQVNVP